MGDEALAIEQTTDDSNPTYEVLTDTSDSDGDFQSTIDAPCGDNSEETQDASIDTGTVDGVQNSIVGDLWDSAGDLVHEAYEGVRYAVGLPTDNADGSHTVKHGDGTTTTTYPDGHRDVHHADGTWTTTYLDGSKLRTNPNGVWIKTLPDGTTVESRPDGTTTTTAAN